MQQELPLGTDEAAVLFDVKKRTFQYWQAGKGCNYPPPAVKVGKRYFYWRRDLIRWGKANGKEIKGGDNGSTGAGT